MRQRNGDWETEMRREAAVALMLLGGVMVGLLAAVIGVLANDFVLGSVLAVVLGLTIVAGLWSRLLR